MAKEIDRIHEEQEEVSRPASVRSQGLASYEPLDYDDTVIASPGHRLIPEHSPNYELRTIRILMGVAFVGIVLMSLAGYVILGLIKTVVDDKFANNSRSNLSGALSLGAECQEGGPQNQCEEGKICIAGSCEPIVAAPLKCQVQQACDGSCNCESPLECQEGICVNPKRITTANADVCREPKIQETLTFLEKQCASRGNKDIVSCPASAWGDFALADDRFDELIAAFPDMMSIHFPAGKPAEGWPDPTVKGHYLSMMRRNEKALKEAKMLFLVARTSPTGSPQHNQMLAQKRMKFTLDLVVESISVSPAQADEVIGRMKTFNLGPKKPISADFFAEKYTNMILTWDPESEKIVRQSIQDRHNLKRRQLDWLNQTINQVVFVVPVPAACIPEKQPVSP